MMDKVGLRSGTRFVFPLLAGLALALMACAPAAAPTPTPTKAPAAAPTKAPEPINPPAAAPTGPPAATPTPRPVTLKFGSVVAVADAGVFVAMEKGYFKEEGITLEAAPFRNVGEMIAPLSTGELSVAGMVLGTAILNAGDRGVGLRIVADKGSSQPRFEISYIVLRKDLAESGRVKTAADLKGMKIAMSSPPEAGGVGYQTVHLMLAEAGLKPTEVEFVVLPFPEMMAAFANKGIAAAFQTEPYNARGVQDGLFVKWKPISSFFGGKVQTTGIVYAPGLVADQDLGRRWMTGYLKGVRYYLKAITAGEGLDDVVSILAKHTPVKEAALYKAMEMPYLDPNGLLDKKSIDFQHNFSVENGFYNGKKTLGEVVDSSFAEYAAQKLGKQ